MSIEFSKKEETAKPEVVGKPEISTLETEESDKKFANEIILKIENDTNFELSSNQEIEKIDSSGIRRSSRSRHEFRRPW